MSQPPITQFAELIYPRGKPVGIKQADRRLHMYIIGKTGTGKTTIIKNLIIQDLRKGHGLGIIDPHGDLVESILDFVPSHRTGEVVYFNPSDRECPVGFNILQSSDDSLKPLLASHVISVFKNIWKDSWGPRLEYILYNSVASLLDVPQSTLLGVPRLLADSKFRAYVVSKIKDPVVKGFWLNEYENYSQNFQQEAIAPIQNKIGQFITNPLIRNIVGQYHNKIDMGFMMERGRVLLCNLSKGKIGEDASSLLGSLIITKIYLSALRRQDQPEEERRDFYLYIDECQNFASSILASILSEARKYRLNLTLAHQYLDQLPEQIKRSIFGNMGTVISFRLGSKDAVDFEKEFFPDYNQMDLQELPKYEICLKLAVDGLTGRAFSAMTLPPAKPGRKEHRKETIIKVSRQRYGTQREVIEAKVNKWLK